MGYDAFGCFRGWCTRASNCLEYSAAGVPTDAADTDPLRCSKCRCLPQEHVIAREEGYDPNSAEHLAERRKHDVRLLPPDERAAIFKGRADAAFKERNFRTAYLEYTRALEATPDSHVLLGNRCQTYLKVGKVEMALLDSEKAVALAPDWAKGHYRHGTCLQLNDRHDEAVAAFARACELDPQSSEAQKALATAREKQSLWEQKQEKLRKARKRTTIRQASDQYEETKYQAKLDAKKSGKIKEITEWGGDLAEKFEKDYRANLRPPAGVEFALTYKPNADGEEADAAAGLSLQLEENVEDGEEGGGLELSLEDNAEEEGGLSMLLEENVEDAGSGSSDSDSDSSSDTLSCSEESDEEAARDAALLDDSKWVPETRDGETRITLPPRNYVLVHEDGRLHEKDDFEPMSFGMQRIHKDDEPEPIWVQTPTARWMQTATDVTIIPYTVPKELCKGTEIKVSFARRQVHVQATRTKEIYMAGELESPINPNISTWTTDGKYITITCAKENLLIYNGSRGADSDTHWNRLFKTDQFVERGMIPANYYDMPAHMKYEEKMAEGKRKAKENAEKAANECPLCGKDIRFFCECRSDDKDYERPLPQGWKDSKLGFQDSYDKYSLSEPNKLQKAPPPQPRPYAGRPTPKYGLDGTREDPDDVPIRMLKDFS